ncbi:MAG: hypothetical protein K0M40_04660 [Prolixibacteraceae bacterium]|nr:hypothetical protein [Prolixibacteraceae bacterium]
MMELFHISCKNYKKGELINSDSFEQTEFYLNSTLSGKNWIDDFLDSQRPIGYPARKSSLFAFDCISNCSVFMNLSFKGLKAKYYRVKMPSPVAMPMCLTDSLIVDSLVHNTKIAKEYWQPIEEWKILEYLSNQMEILEVISESSEEEKISGSRNYHHDIEKRDRL